MSLLTPKKVKHRKQFKGVSKGVSGRGTTIAFGSYGLKAMETRWITARQIEAARRAILRFLKKQGKLWVRIFPAKPITAKGAETPMGAGKGGVDHYVYPIKPGRIIFELDGLPEETARQAFKKAGAKFPIATKFVVK